MLTGEWAASCMRYGTCSCNWRPAHEHKVLALQRIVLRQVMQLT